MSIARLVHHIYGEDKYKEVFYCINKHIEVSLNKVIQLMSSEPFKNDLFEYRKLYPTNSPQADGLGMSIEFILGALIMKATVVHNLINIEAGRRGEYLEHVIRDITSDLKKIDLNNPGNRILN